MNGRSHTRLVQLQGRPGHPVRQTYMLLLFPNLSRQIWTARLGGSVSILYNKDRPHRETGEGLTSF
ncbi:hypothetical protein FRC15_002176, partial [Serendipita sp. 397]